MSLELARKAIAIDEEPDALDYRVRMTPEQAAVFCKERDPWVGDLLAQIDKIVPPSKYEDESNPNHGRTHHHYFIGQEGSRVVYVQVIRAYLESYQVASDLNDQIIKLAKTFDPDEVEDRSSDGSIFLRLWWDA